MNKNNQNAVRIELLASELAPSFLCQKLIVSLCSFPNEILKWDVKQRGWGPLIALIDAFRTLCGSWGHYATLGMSVALKMAAYLPHHLKVFNQNLQAEMCCTDSMSSLIPMHHGVLFKGIKRRKSKPSKNSLTCFCMDVTQALHKEWHELEINFNCIYIVHEKQFRKVITVTPHVYEEHTHFTHLV